MDFQRSPGGSRRSTAGVFYEGELFFSWGKKLINFPPSKMGGSEKIDILVNILKYFIQFLHHKTLQSTLQGQEKALISLKIAPAAQKVSKIWKKR